MPLRDIIANELKSTGPLAVNEQEIDCDYSHNQIPQPTHHQQIRAKTLQQSQSDEFNLPNKAYNSKTVQLMNKMQSEFEEKQKRRKMRRTEQLKNQQQQFESSTSSPKLSKSTSELKSATTTPKSERKFLTSIINTLFSTGSYEAPDTSPTQNNNSALQKNETKRLSLRKIKAKNKAKKTGDQNDTEFNQSDSEINNNSDVSSKKFNKSSSNHSLNVALNYESNNEDDIVDYMSNQPSTSTMASLPIAAARFGKIKNEDDKPQINENNKENLMKQLKAELDEEIKDRRMVELKQNIINGLNNDVSESASGGYGGSSTSSHVSAG